MTGTPGSGRRRLWRPDWTWRVRQASCAILVVWFAGAIVLTVVAGISKNRAGGFALLGWFLLLMLFGLVMSVLDGRLRREWRRIADRHGWTVAATAPELAGRWRFPPFDASPNPQVMEVTSGRHRGRAFRTGMSGTGSAGPGSGSPSPSWRSTGRCRRCRWRPNR